MKKELNEQVSRIKEMMNLPTENENEITEAGFSKVAQTLRGIVPKIKTIAIITAENPQGKEYPSNINKQRNNELKKDISRTNNNLDQYLSSGFYGYRQIKGQYGNLENPFIINNISKEEAVRLGEKYDQDTIIFGEVKVQEEKNEPIEKPSYWNKDIMVKTNPIKVEMFFQMIKATGENKNEVVGTQRIFVVFGKEGESKPQDFYSEVKGRKFVIPFYGITDMLKTKLEDSENLYKYEKRERKYDKARWIDGKNEPATDEVDKDGKKLDPVIKTPSTKEKWDEWNVDEQKLNEIVDEMITSQGSKAYNCRGRYKMILAKYGILIN